MTGSLDSLTKLARTRRTESGLSAYEVGRQLGRARAMEGSRVEGLRRFAAGPVGPITSLLVGPAAAFLLRRRLGVGRAGLVGAGVAGLGAVPMHVESVLAARHNLRANKRLLGPKQYRQVRRHEAANQIGDALETASGIAGAIGMARWGLKSARPFDRAALLMGAGALGLIPLHWRKNKHGPLVQERDVVRYQREIGTNARVRAGRFNWYRNGEVGLRRVRRKEK